MSKHTPGPWSFDGAINVAYAGYFSVGFPDGSGFCVPYDIGEANARLIAAAPDLLEALQVLANVTAADNSPKRIREIALAAIAKAEGRTV